VSALAAGGLQKLEEEQGKQGRLPSRQWGRNRSAGRPAERSMAARAAAACWRPHLYSLGRWAQGYQEPARWKGAGTERAWLRQKQGQAEFGGETGQWVGDRRLCRRAERG
jgi:hypothetical protein